MEEFCKNYSIHVYETGTSGKLTPYNLFNYMQDIASDHAVKLGFGRDDLMRENQFWVLSRIYAEIDRWPEWGDQIILKTWPNGIEKLFALRNYEVCYPDGRHIASATSSWLILDQTSRKVQRPDQALARFNRDLNPGPSPVRYATKLEPVSEEGKESNPFRVKPSDLDVNQHTNNVRYLNWICDTYTPDFIESFEPFSVEINYLAESAYNEEVTVKQSDDKKEEGFITHSVIRKDGSKELCRTRIGWRRIDDNIR